MSLPPHGPIPRFGLDIPESIPVGTAATTLFFCKYNYGLIWVLPMMANELLRAHSPSGLQPTETLKRLGAALRRPWPALLVVGLLAAAIIEIAGPWRFSVGDRTVTVSSAGRLLYALYALTLLGWLLRPRRSLHVVRQLFARIDSRARSMLVAIAVPVALWMVVPSHTINFVSFLVNRSAGAPVLSLESLVFYPRVFLNEFFPMPAVGFVVLLFAAVSLRRFRGADEAGRVLAIALLFSIIATIAHPYKQPRFLVLTATLLWFTGSREAVELVARGSRRVGENTRRRIAADPPELVIVLSAAPGSQPRAGFNAETRWLEPVRRQLASDSRFRLVRRKDFPDPHYRLEAFEPTRTDGEPVPR